MTEWMKSFVGYLLIAGVATQMLPAKKYEQYVRLFLGFLLIILVLQPILRIGSANGYLQERLAAFVREQEILEEQILIRSEAFRQESEELKEETTEEIKIEEIERVQVEVTMDD